MSIYTKVILKVVLICQTSKISTIIMQKTGVILMIALTIMLLSCSNKTDSPLKISKQEYANDIAKYVIIGEDIYQNGERDANGVYTFEERHNGYFIDNQTDYTLDNVIVEFSLSAKYHNEYLNVQMEFNYIKAQQKITITNREIIKALDPDLSEYSFTITSFKIKKIKSSALGI